MSDTHVRFARFAAARAFAPAFALALALAFAASVAVPAECLAQALPSPQELLARHDSLVGGRAALDTHTSVRITGTFAVPVMALDAPLEILKRKPNKYVLRTSLGQMGDLMSGYDGANAWAIQPGQGPTLLVGAQATQLAQQADFYGDLHDLTRFTSVETVDQTEFEGQRAFRVRMVRPNGDSVTEFFDVATGLSIGATNSISTPTGRVETTSLFTDYKEFSGLRVPTRVVQRNPQFELIITILTLEFDTVDEAAILPPESIRLLIKP